MTDDAHKLNFDDIKQAAKINEVAAFLGLQLKQKNVRRWQGACPFCKGADSFIITVDGGRDKAGAFNCFRCPAGGDQIELVSLARGHARKNRQGAYAAAKELHQKFLGGTGEKTVNRSNPSPQPQEERRKGFDAEAYVKTLDPEHEALAPLGIDAETLRDWKAGYSSSGVNRGRLALPIALPDGTVAAYVGRALNDALPVLSCHKEFDPRGYLFGADRVSEGEVTVVRDVLDVLKASESGIDNVVAFLTESIQIAQLEVLISLMHERKVEAITLF
jgi:hypothetical protein